MIQFDINFIDKWNKKIIYAPNGFGKTSNANLILETLERKNEKVLLFTRKKLESLIIGFENKLYFGLTAEKHIENDSISMSFNTINPLKNFFKTNYSTYSINKLKTSSFTYSMKHGKKIEDITTLLSFDFSFLTPLSFSDAIELDKILNKNLYEQAKLLIAEKSKIKIPKKHKKKIDINSEIFDEILDLKDYIESSDNSTCLLCGKKFKSKEKLIIAIEKQIKKFAVLDENNLFNMLLNTCARIHQIFFNSKFHTYLYKDDIDISTIKGMLELLEYFIKLCEVAIKSMIFYIGNIPFKESTIREYVNKINQNNLKIEKEMKSINNTSNFISFIIEEMKKIISNDNSIEFIPDGTKLAVSILLDGQKTDKSMYDFLSESEMKRFSLIVLHSLIKFGNYDNFILDDPIDSYDDYYLTIACNYICDILKIEKINRWYIFSNNYEALSLISNKLKCNCIVYQHNPKNIFTNNPFDYIFFECNHKQVHKIFQGELCLLSEFLEGAKNADPDLSFLAFIITLRNFKSSVLKKFKYLFIKKGNKTNNLYKSDEEFDIDISNIIEKYYMHFCDESDPSFGYNSDSLKINDIYKLFCRLSNFSEKNSKKYKENNESVSVFRESICKKDFFEFDGNKMLNLILLKIVLISYLKYNFEKMLIVKLRQNYGYTEFDIQKIVNKNALGRKISEADKLNASNKYGAKDFLQDFNEIYTIHNNLFNSFDHALELMFPPYLATSLKDIKKFRIDVDCLDKKYM